MSRTLLLSLAAIAIASACGGSSKPAARTGAGSVGAKMTPVSLDETFRLLAKGQQPAAVCFAFSSQEKAAACAVSTSSVQDGARFEVRAGAKSFAYYTHSTETDGGQFLELDPAKIDQAQLASARKHLDDHSYQAWGDTSVKLAAGTTIKVGTASLRRTRTVTEEAGDPATGTWSLYQDKLELSCGATWKLFELPEGVFGHELGDLDITVAALADKRLLLSAVSDWAMEGDNGDGRDATIIDPALACQ